jgi:hypothetical protein
MQVGLKEMIGDIQFTTQITADEGHPGSKPHSSLGRCGDKTTIEQPRMEPTWSHRNKTSWDGRNVKLVAFAMTGKGLGTESVSGGSRSGLFGCLIPKNAQSRHAL